MSRVDLVALNEIQHLSVRRACDVQKAVLALESALMHAEQADALARVMWPEAQHGKRRTAKLIRDALDVLRCIQNAQAQAKTP